MSIFEILILCLFTIFVIVNIYLGISGRILNIKQTNIENKRAEHQTSWDEQVNALSLKCYEFQSENLKLHDELRKYFALYNETKTELEKYKKA